MTDSTSSRSLPGPRAFIIAGCCLALVLLAAFAWQASVHSSQSDDAERHLEVATLLKSAGADATAAGEILRQYVETGDETLLPQMREKTDSGVRQLTAAISLYGDDPNQFVQQGGAFVQEAGRIVALRQAGDIAGAADALSRLGAEFEVFAAAQAGLVSTVEEKAAEADNQASDAETAAFWLAVAIAADMLAVLSVLALVVVRRGARRATAGAATSA